MKPTSASPAPVPREPHPPLTDYYDGPNERTGWLRGIFDRTAEDYDRIEQVVGLGSGRAYRRKALLRAGLVRGMRVLDVGAGTGLVTKEAVAIVGAAGEVTAVDPSPGMLGVAHFPERVTVLQGLAEQLPVADEAYDFVSMGFALRHVSGLDAAFAEFHRVLKPGGRVCILEITRPAGRVANQLLRLYMRRVVPAVAWVVARQRETVTLLHYYWDTIEACVPPAQVLAALERAGFTKARCATNLRIFSEYTATKAD